MATFQIHHDSIGKENPVLPAVPKEKLGKQPLGVIGKEKIALAPRANFDANANKARGALAPAGKEVLRDTANLKTIDENTIYAGIGGKKSNFVPVVEQFKTISVYEDNVDTQVGVPHLRVGKILPAAAAAAQKENQNYSEYSTDVKFDTVNKHFVAQHGHNFSSTTPMHVTDMLSPMSVDRSMISSSGAELTDDSSVQGMSETKLEAANAIAALNEETAKPRNDRDRFFDVVDYQWDILENFREIEKKHRPKPQYMRRQTDITHSMRTILVDWLVEVSEEYNLDTETLFLAVSYIDRFLSQMSVVRSKLQLVGTAAMYIASKYEEIYPPDVVELVYITDNTYTKSQVLRMEQIILKILCFNLCTPTPYVFVNTYSVLLNMPEKLKHLTLFICELSLLDAEQFLHYLPSLVSAAALALSRHILGLEIWSPEYEEITTYKLADLREVVLKLAANHMASKDLNTQAIQKKYIKDKYKRVADIEPIILNEAHFNVLWKAYNEANVRTQPEPINVNSKKLFQF